MNHNQNINRSAEYIALWKSRWRAGWEAARLSREAAALLSPAEPPGRWQQGQRDAGAVAVIHQVEEAATGEDVAILAERLRQESQRMQQLAAELDAELAKVAETLTPAQRKNAEKVLQLWEQEARNSF